MQYVHGPKVDEEGHECVLYVSIFNQFDTQSDTLQLMRILIYYQDKKVPCMNIFSETREQILSEVVKEVKSIEEDRNVGVNASRPHD